MLEEEILLLASSCNFPFDKGLQGAKALAEVLGKSKVTELNLSANEILMHWLEQFRNQFFLKRRDLWKKIYIFSFEIFQISNFVINACLERIFPCNQDFRSPIQREKCCLRS